MSLRRTGRACELGYALGTSRSGRGVATSAVRRVLRWVDEESTAVAVRARTDPENVASVRVLESCGLALVRRETGASTRPGLGHEPRDSLVFERPSARSVNDVRRSARTPRSRALGR